ncbi:MAG: carbohydrate-binding domain-containing protein [Alloprevotella sp.]
MKKLYSFLLLAGIALSSAAQTMRVHCGPVCTLIPAATAGDIVPSADAASLTVMGNTFSVADIDSIVVDQSVYTPGLVDVTYDGVKARVTVAGDVAPLLALTVADASVSVLQDPTLASEVTYRLHGASDNGFFGMDGEYKATVILDNLQLTNQTQSAISIENGKRIKVILPEGTTSTLADGVGGVQKACFFINGHAEFSGKGVLNLVGNSKHAFASDEYAQFSAGFGTLNVTRAESDAMHIGQYLDARGGTFNLSGTKGDCIDVEKTKDAADVDNGFVRISGGVFNLDVAADDTKGIKNDSTFYVTGGTINATVSGNGAKGISAAWDMFINQSSGNATAIKMTVSGTTYMPGDPVLESKCRGIKGKRDLTFDGGDINMTVTGAKAKGISLDGTWNYVSGTTNVLPS